MSRPRATSVSAQKAHRGRRSEEKAEIYNAPPPAPPATRKPRSSPSEQRSKKAKAASPTARE